MCEGELAWIMISLCTAKRIILVLNSSNSILLVFPIFIVSKIKLSNHININGWREKNYETIFYANVFQNHKSSSHIFEAENKLQPTNYSVKVNLVEMWKYIRVKNYCYTKGKNYIDYLIYKRKFFSSMRKIINLTNIIRQML